jgi:DNA-binding SARP family transcriptional activator
MARLSLRFLGTFQVTLEATPITSFVSDKARALLAYLAVDADRPHRRESLTSLFWPERPRSAAHNSLRQALFSVRRAIGDQDTSPPFLLVTRHAIQFNPTSDFWLDVTAFTERLAASKAHTHPQLETCSLCMQRLEQAADLFRGDFLEGLTLGDSLAFEEWALLKREWLHSQVLDALRYVTDYHEQQGNYQQARDRARQQIQLDPWREEAHQQLMRLLELCGQRQAALAQYETCRRILAQELGIEPSQGTTDLYHRIRASR